MTRHGLTAWVVLLCLSVFSACSGVSGSDSDGTEIEAAQTEVGTNVGNPNAPSSGDTEVGTNVGNPSTPVKAAVTNAISFKTSVTESAIPDESAAEDSSTDGDSHGGVTASSPDCVPIAFDSDQRVAASQMCSVTPADYRMGILAISLAECADDSGSASLCDPKEVVDITARATLYDGDQVDVAITTNGIGFPRDLEVLSEGESLSSGGLQVVTAYVGGTFPDATDDPEGAEKVASYLRGRTFRVCTTPESVGEETILARCGNAKAKFGDLLVDLDGDGTFGFVNTATIAEGFAEETATPPEDYSGFVDLFLTNFEGEAASFYTTIEDYSVEGYFAQLWPFDSLLTVDAQTSNAFDVTVGIADTVIFTDGRARRDGSGGDVCVAALFESGCRYGNDDPASVGVYDPYYDGSMAVTAPLPGVTVEQTQ